MRRDREKDGETKTERERERERDWQKVSKLFLRACTYGVSL